MGFIEWGALIQFANILDVNGILLKDIGRIAFRPQTLPHQTQFILKVLFLTPGKLN